MSEKLKVGILGGTGMVGQRFIHGLRLPRLQQAQEVQERLMSRQWEIVGKWILQCRKL